MTDHPNDRRDFVRPNPSGRNSFLEGFGVCPRTLGFNLCNLTSDLCNFLYVPNFLRSLCPGSSTSFGPFKNDAQRTSCTGFSPLWAFLTAISATASTIHSKFCYPR